MRKTGRVRRHEVSWIHQAVIGPIAGLSDAGTETFLFRPYTSLSLLKRILVNLAAASAMNAVSSQLASQQAVEPGIATTASWGRFQIEPGVASLQATEQASKQASSGGDVEFDSSIIDWLAVSAALQRFTALVVKRTHASPRLAWFAQKPTEAKPGLERHKREQANERS